MISGEDEAKRDLAGLAVPAVDAVNETGDLWEPSLAYFARATIVAPALGQAEQAASLPVGLERPRIDGHNHFAFFE